MALSTTFRRIKRTKAQDSNRIAEIVMPMESVAIESFCRLGGITMGCTYYPNGSYSE